MGPNTGSNIFGGITFVLIIVVALAAVAVMIYGRYLKQRRLAGEKELIERREAAHVDAVVVEPEAPLKEEVMAPVEPVDDVPVATPSAPKTKAKAAPKAEAATSPKAEAATKAKARTAPKAAAVAPTVSPKVEPTPKARAAVMPKAAPKAEVVTPAASPKAEPAPKTKTTPKPKAAPKAEAAAPAASPPPEVAPVPTPASDGDITQLKGLGPKLATTLAELGYTRLDQIAALTPDQAADLDAKLGAFQGRMARDRWTEQATLLVAGDRAAYEAAFGKLG
jgi:predicted flap endonuclease-1-like 5' DNA nuclease